MNQVISYSTPYSSNTNTAVACAPISWYRVRHDMATLIKVFALYAYYPDDMWDIVELAETDVTIRKKLMDRYKIEFFEGNSQQGGRTKSEKYCAKHDRSATYEYELL